MHIRKALEKIETLTISEVEHMEQLCADEITRYEFSIQNYPPDRMEKYGVPYLQMLQERHAIFSKRLEELKHRV